MAKVLKVEKANAVSLFMALGFKTAPKWDVKKLHERINAIEEAPAEPLEDKVLDGLLDEILGSDVIEIVDEEKPPVKKGKEEDVEDEDGEKPAKKGKGKKEKKEKVVKEKKAKKEKVKSKKNLNRTIAATDALVKLKKSGETVENIIQAADEIIVRDGGNSNPKEAGYSCHRVIQVFERLGMVTVEDGKVKPVSPA